MENDARNQRATDRRKYFIQEISDVSLQDKNIDFVSVDKSKSMYAINIPNKTISRSREMNFNFK